MCCFSIPTPKSFWQRLRAPKIHVSATQIFGRIVAPGVQGLAYSMNLESAREVAMILPIPVRPGTGESALRFLNLEKHPRMFTDLDALFVDISNLPRKGGLSVAARPQTLVVHDVGSFIATYVPTKLDFDRVDRQFWLPRILLDSVPAYSDYGFAVFQLKAGKHTVHPMAFTFPSRELDRLYFPTVHLHDGQFRRDAEFDHALYYQHPRVREQGGTFEGDPTSYLMPSSDYEGLVDKSRPIVKRTVRGKQPNQDIWVKTGRPITVNSV
ncbi:MAG TPA: hypothetical protein VMZ53_26155 [Kofleriaceae bacterium]|nr:hypothetical protein [Kofleriaceae bacterium]